MSYIKETTYYKLQQLLELYFDDKDNTPKRIYKLVLSKEGSKWFFSDNEETYGSYSPKAPLFTGNSLLGDTVSNKLDKRYKLETNGKGPFTEYISGYISNELHYVYSIKHKDTPPMSCQCILCRLMKSNSEKEFEKLKLEWDTDPLSDCFPKNRICVLSEVEI